jgi:hypothetical protein
MTTQTEIVVRPAASAVNHQLPANNINLATIGLLQSGDGTRQQKPDAELPKHLL